jgi:tetrapyrrole methylase family protein / MazG family protein
MAVRGTVVIVGLASGDPGLCTAATLEAIAQPWPRFVRTARHPSAHLVEDATSFDDVYDRRDTFEEVYREIVETLVDAANKHGEILYAVPGSPNVLERTVELLVADERVDTEVVPAMSFLELAWSRLAIDPIEAGVRLVDGHTFAASAAGQTGPLLIAHCHNQRVLSDIKLALDDDGATEVVVLQRLGLPDEAVFSVPWADLDRAVEADHLTSLYVPVLPSPVAAELVRFDQLVKTLRAECPWDSVQTHRSLRRHLIEESYEVLDAIDGFDPQTGAGVESLEEELGDLLFQVFLHSAIAAEGGWFELADVARVIHDKLFDRHPHIFDVDSGADAPTLVSWEVAKLAEKDRQSVMDGVAAGLPALAYADKVLKKASVVQAPTELEVGRPDDPAIGRALLALVVRARNVDVDPEMALRQEARRLADKVRRYEALAAESDIDVISAEPAMVASLWAAASGA